MEFSIIKWILCNFNPMIVPLERLNYQWIFSPKIMNLCIFVESKFSFLFCPCRVTSTILFQYSRFLTNVTFMGYPTFIEWLYLFISLLKVQNDKVQSYLLYKWLFEICQIYIIYIHSYLSQLEFRVFCWSAASAIRLAYFFKINGNLNNFFNFD